MGKYQTVELKKHVHNIKTYKIQNMGENIETDKRKNGKYKTAERKYDKNIKSGEPRQNTIESWHSSGSWTS